MAQLEIHLQRGFARDDVIVKVNGSEILENLAVTTDAATGLAIVIQAEAPDGQVTVRFAVPSRGIVEDVRVDATRTPFLGVGLAANGESLVAHSVSAPFQYTGQ